MPILQKRVHFWAAGLLGSSLLRLHSLTWRLSKLEPDSLSDQLRKRTRQIFIAFWHRHLMVVLCAYRGLHFCAPVSTHKDGEYVAHVMERLGSLAVRGSTTRGSVNLLRGMLRAVKEGWNCGVTPDGPRGPRFTVQPGVIMLARRSGLPLYPVGVAAKGAWVLNSWDAFVIPKPGAKVCIFFGQPLLPETLSSLPIGTLCAMLKESLEDANRQAELSCQEA